MTLAEEIEFWQQQERRTKSKELALVCFGIRCGLQFARDEHMKRAVEQRPPVTGKE